MAKVVATVKMGALAEAERVRAARKCDRPECGACTLAALSAAFDGALGFVDEWLEKRGLGELSDELIRAVANGEGPPVNADTLEQGLYHALLECSCLAIVEDST